MTADEADRQRKELAHLTMDLIGKRGAAITRADLVSESRTSKARIEELFPEETNLFEAVVELWYSHDIEIMESVVASDLPIQRKFYEFYAQRYARERQRYDDDPALFALYVELGEAHFEQVRGYIDLADHYLTELIAQAQVEGFFDGLDIERALTLINQMMIAYTSPQVMLMISHRLEETKLAAIVDTLFAGLSGQHNHSSGVSSLRMAD